MEKAREKVADEIRFMAKDLEKRADDIAYNVNSVKEIILLGRIKPEEISTWEVTYVIYSNDDNNFHLFKEAKDDERWKVFNRPRL